MRVAISLDERSRALFAGRLGRGDVVYCPANGDELRRLARAGSIDVAVVDLFHTPPTGTSAVPCPDEHDLRRRIL